MCWPNKKFTAYTTLLSHLRSHAGFRPSACEPDELAEACLEARRRHSSVYQIMRRACDRKTHMKDLWSLATYIAYNPLFRDEMLKKHDMLLGYRDQERTA